MNARTLSNLKTAMKSEAFAHAEYARLAAAARLEGNWELAKLFQKTADDDRIEHFRQEFDLAKLCSDDAENVRKSISEKEEQIQMYKGFERQAYADGDTVAAHLFHRISEHEMEQIAAFQKALGRITAEVPTPEKASV